MKRHKGEMGRQWTGSEMGKKIKENEYPEVVPLTVITLSLSFSQSTKELELDILSMVLLKDRCECYSKRYSCLTKNYHHMQACDNYYTKLYITNKYT